MENSNRLLNQGPSERCCAIQQLFPNMAKNATERHDQLQRLTLAKQTYGYNWSPVGNHIFRVQWSRDLWRHVTPKGQDRNRKILAKTDPSQARRTQLKMTQRESMTTTSTVPGQMVMRVLKTKRVLKLMRFSAPILRDDASENSRLWSSITDSQHTAYQHQHQQQQQQQRHQ